MKIQLLLVFPFLLFFSCKKEEVSANEQNNAEIERLDVYEFETREGQENDKIQRDRFKVLDFSDVVTNCTSIQKTVFDSVGFSNELLLNSSISIDYWELVVVDKSKSHSEPYSLHTWVESSFGESSIDSDTLFPTTGFDLDEKWSGEDIDKSRSYEKEYSYIRFEHNGESYYVTSEEELKKFIGEINSTWDVLFWFDYIEQPEYGNVSLFKEINGGYEVLLYCPWTSSLRDGVRFFINKCGDVEVWDDGLEIGFQCPVH